MGFSSPVRGIKKQFHKPEVATKSQEPENNMGVPLKGYTGMYRVYNGMIYG